MRLVRVADQRRMPWKNGGGETAELAAFPDGAALDAFDWRVSMARVGRDGPFSTFAGVDRTLAVLDGDGLALAFGGEAERVVAVDTPPASFAGELATTGRLLGGSILDLNVMTRRGRWTHRLTSRVLAGPTTFDAGRGTTWIVIATGEPLSVKHGPSLLALARHDAVVIAADDHGDCTLVPEGGARAWVIELSPVV